MSSSPIIFSVLLLFIFFTLSSSVKTSFRPKALVLPVTKDKATLQYTTIINQRTPLVPVSVVFDLSGRDLWVDCETDYVSSSYKSPRCKSAVCSLSDSGSCFESYVGPPKANRAVPNNTCAGSSRNTLTETSTGGVLALDVISIQSTNGFNPGRVVKIPNMIFDCGITLLLDGLAKGTVGMAGFGRLKIGLPSQFSAAFSFKRKFAVCLSSSSRGVAFFGNGPYVFLPGVEISKLETTPLVIAPPWQGEKSPEYFIGLTAIKIAGKNIPINPKLLKIDANTRIGGTKISTVQPYTMLESSIFNAFTTEFVRQANAMNIKRVAAVEPFGACFSTKNVGVTRLGYAVPEIQLVLHSKDVVWRISGANSMVNVKNNVMCLGFIKKIYPGASVLIGGHQLEDNLIEFDLESNRLGFSSTLLGRRTNCANFNFTSTA